MKNSCFNHQTQFGVSLMEILVSMLIIAIGMLGTAALHFRGVRSNTTAYQHIQANFYANDAVERIRLNPITDDNPNLYANLDSKSINCGTPPPKQCAAEYSVTSDSCTADEMAAFDFHEVFCGSPNLLTDGLTAALPASQITISCVTSPCSNSARRNITVAWNSENNATSPVRRSVVLRY